MGRKSNSVNAVKVLIILCISAAAGYGVLAGYGRWLSRSECLAVRKIVLTGNDLLSDRELREAAGLVTPNHMKNISLTSIDRKLRKIPFIQSVKVSKSYPGSIELSIEEKQPVALLRVEEELYCIDSEGLVLPSRPGKLYNLPIISGHFRGGVRVGMQVENRRIGKSLSLVRTVIDIKPELYNQISEIVTGTADSLLVYTVEKSIPVKFGFNNIVYKVHCFDAVLKKLAAEQSFSDIRYIDLRYANQVILGMRI